MSLKQIIDYLIEAQDILEKLIDERDKLYYQKELEMGRGNVALLSIYSGDGITNFKLACDSNTGRIRYASDHEPILHTIEMSEDTFIDLLTGEIDFQKAFFRGNIIFRGENWFYHATKWGIAIRRLRYLLDHYLST